MMAESEDALRPALERVREIVPIDLWLFMLTELNLPDDHCMTKADHPHD